MGKITKKTNYTIRTGDWNLDEYQYEITLNEEQALELRDELIALLVDTGK